MPRRPCGAPRRRCRRRPKSRRSSNSSSDGRPRAFSTAIYYLLRAGERSALHRIKSDEVWHHYAGDAVTMWLLEASGKARSVVLGGDGAPQIIVPAGAWYGARIIDGGTVAPGFDFADFELADRAALVATWPGQRAVIEALTYPQ